MQHDLTHASFFSGVGGLDLGLERAGWRTVSFSEIDPYASAVLAERWPGVPNLGDIVDVDAQQRGRPRGDCGDDQREQDRRLQPRDRDAWADATLWSGGFPCQDLSVAGKRAGFAGARSGLAFAFLDLVERHRPPAILLENVPGLLSSHGGKDFGALLARLVELGYGWAYRILDAQHFGVPQRRRRVFIVAFHAESGLGADSAAEVLSVGARCERHPATGHPKGTGVAESTVASPLSASAGHHGHSSPRGDGADNIVGPLDTALGHHGAGWPDQSVHAGHLIGKTPDPGGVRASDGLAGRLDGDTVGPLLTNAKGGRGSTDLNTPLAFSQNQRGEVLAHEQAHQLTAGGGKPGQGYSAALGSFTIGRDDPLLPLGLDSHRYRCCGNGVVSSVAEWIGTRLAEMLTPASASGSSAGPASLPSGTVLAHTAIGGKK